MDYSKSALSGLVDIITDPSKALLAAEIKPMRLWLPFILAMLLPAILSFYYFSTIDVDWMFQQMQDAAEINGQELPDDMREFFTSSTMMGVAVGGSIMMAALITSISAVYLLMVAKVSSEDNRSFGKWFSLSAWVSVPNSLAALLMIIYYVIMGSNQIGLEELSFFSLNGLVMHYPNGTMASTFYTAITPFLVWSIALLGLGIKIWTGRAYGSSMLIAALPYVVIFGIWGMVVL